MDDLQLVHSSTNSLLSEASPEEVQSKFENVQSLLDEIESQIEGYRTKALALVEEKKQIKGTLTTLSTLPENLGLTEIDQEEIKTTLDRLIKRLDSIQIQAYIQRDEEQIDAVVKAGEMLDLLVVDLETQAPTAETTLQSYLSCCSATESGSPNVKFEKILLACASEDQKAIKRRLHSIKEFTEETKAANE